MSTPPTVPKPTNAGAGVTAIINTRAAYVNVRTGPSTNYTDIGDIRDNSLVVYFPNTRTRDDWYWVEHRSASGWIAGSVVTFEPVVGGTLPQQDPTPYDGKTAVWHWRGDSLPERTLDEFVANLKQRAPNVRQIWVKTSDGTSFQGAFDRSEMAIDGVADVDRWVATLERAGLEFHAWCVPNGLDIEREVAVIAEVCRRPGVKSMILDIEPYAGFWQGGREAIRPFMVRLRQLIGGRFHIGMSMDPRPWHYNSIFPAEWFPFVNSLHPQSYWATFRATPEATLQQVYDTWGGYGRPIIPALQGDAPIIEQNAAHTLATKRHGAPGLSWWRYGVISQYSAVNLPVEIQTPTEPGDRPEDIYDDEVIIKPLGPGFRSGSYTGQQEFRQFEGTWGWPVLYKKTEVNTSRVWAEWRADLPESGRYEIATFVPARNATTSRARFKIHGIRGTSTEVVVDINQSRERNRWVALGIFDLVKGAPNAGRVFLNDVTGEADALIAFDAVRFRRIITTMPDNGGSGGIETPVPPIVDGVHIADGFDSPIGTPEERSGATTWPKGWRDATGFGSNTVAVYVSRYNSYHTGVDLNWGSGGNSDLGMPCYSPASGVVIYQNELRPWGNLTIIRHDPLKSKTGLVVYSRFGHMQNVTVSVGQRVRRGEKIGEIGTGGGRYIAHLHFDISPTTVLETSPGDWPGMNLSRLLKNYVDPRFFIGNNRPAR